MFRSRPRTSTTLGEAVDLLLSLLTPAAMDTLLEMQEEQLAEHQIVFAAKLCDRWELDEEDLLDICIADDVETAAANLIKATWSEARKRRLH
jgi:hypothetical protein